MPLAMVDYALSLPGFLSDYLKTIEQSSSGSGTMVSLDCSLSSKTAPKALQALFIDISLPGKISCMSHCIHRLKAERPDTIGFNTFSTII